MHIDDAAGNQHRMNMSLKAQGFEMRVDDVAGNIPRFWGALPRTRGGA